MSSETRSVYFAPCGCEYSGGSWGVCGIHANPHSEHTAEDRAPWCPECEVELLDDAEPEDVCRGCGQFHVSHARTDADEYCPECRFGRGESKEIAND